MYAAILAGGSGTRLWPRSRQAQPKQFADILGTGRTMIQATADRLEGLVNGDQLYVVTGAQYAALAAEPTFANSCQSNYCRTFWAQFRASHWFGLYSPGRT